MVVPEVEVAEVEGDVKASAQLLTLTWSGPEHTASTYARNSSLRKLPTIPKLSSIHGVVKNNFLPRNGSKFWEKTVPPFNGEKKKSHGLTYVDKQLIRLKRNNFSGRLQSLLGNRAASIFISIYVSHLPHLLPTKSMFCHVLPTCRALSVVCTHTVSDNTAISQFTRKNVIICQICQIQNCIGQTQVILQYSKSLSLCGATFVK